MPLFGLGPLDGERLVLCMNGGTTDHDHWGEQVPRTDQPREYAFSNAGFQRQRPTAAAGIVRTDVNNQGGWSAIGDFDPC
jgi:hypothetical protein